MPHQADARRETPADKAEQATGRDAGSIPMTRPAQKAWRRSPATVFPKALNRLPWHTPSTSSGISCRSSRRAGPPTRRGRRPRRGATRHSSTSPTTGLRATRPTGADFAAASTNDWFGVSRRGMSSGPTAGYVPDFVKERRREVAGSGGGWLLCRLHRRRCVRGGTAADIGAAISQRDSNRRFAQVVDEVLAAQGAVASARLAPTEAGFRGLGRGRRAP